MVQDVRTEFQIFSLLRHGITAMDDHSASLSSKLGSFAPKTPDGGDLRRAGEQLCEVSAALKAFGVTAEELNHVLCLLIALLHLTHIHVAPPTGMV